MKHHAKKTPQQQVELERAALEPKPCEDLGGLEEGTLKWGRSVRRCRESPLRGAPCFVDEARQGRAFMGMLPAKIRELAFLGKG